jgi:membrane protease YdiL (CAAX protease family)
MNPASYPVLPHQPVSFRTVYWLFLISLAATCWYFLAVSQRPNQELRVMLDWTNRPDALDQMFAMKGAFARPAYWVIEELVFRGILFQVLRRYLPLSPALLISAAAFALIHFAYGGVTMAVAFAFSYYFAWLMIRTNSIYAPIVAHWCFDFSALYIVFPILAAAGRFNGSSVSFPLYLWPLSVAVIFVGIWMLRREFRRGPAHRVAANLVPAQA